jgi:hypothetical protein
MGFYGFNVEITESKHRVLWLSGAPRASREKVGTGFSQKRYDNKQLEQDAASELAHLALGPKTEQRKANGG